MKGIVLTTLPGWQIGLLFQKFGSSLSLRRVDSSLFVLKMQILPGGTETIAAEVGQDGPFLQEVKEPGTLDKIPGFETSMRLRGVWK